MIKVVVLHNFVVPHSFPLLRELAKKKDIDLEVFYLAESASNRRWQVIPKDPGFRYKILPNYQINFFTKDLFTYIINPTIVQELAKSKYDVVISDGWLDFSCQLVSFLSKLQRKKYILWSESTFNEPSWRRTLSMPLVKTMVRLADAYLARGTRAKEYLAFLGANPQKIFIAPCVIDVDFFHQKSKLSMAEKNQLERKLQIKSKSLVLMYSGQLIERKGLIYLFDAFGKIEEKYGDRVALLIQGYGPIKDKLLKFCRKRRIKNIVFSGHVETEEIPKIYALADIFILPSYEETWGRVINEAMACNLPIITTRKVGASADIVKERVNGFIVEERSSVMLQRAIETLLNDSILRKRMGEASWRISQDFTPALAAEGVYQAIKFVKNNEKAKQ